jgi:hypothetical protein
MVDEMRSEGDRDPIDETKVKLAVGDDAAGVNSAMFGFFHVSRQSGQRLETEFTPDALENVFGRVGTFAQPVALPG